MIIGITGTSGSGKTTLSNILSKRADVAVLDADKIAKELTNPGTEYLEAIKNILGDKYIKDDGNLNRKELADEIYVNKDSLEKLNALTFKYVVDEMLERIKELEDESKYIVADIPLLFESGFENFCDYTISLISDYETKIKRICIRDNIDEETAKKRLNIQHNDDYYITKSDFVINNTNECNLEEEIERILNKIDESSRF